MKVLCNVNLNSQLPEVLPNERAPRKVQSLYEGQGRAVLWSPRYGLGTVQRGDRVCRPRAPCPQQRALYGLGQAAQIKQRASDVALQLVA